jgi:translation initiation factor 2A
MFKGGKPAQRYVPGHGIPGAGPPGSATPGGGKDADKKKRVRSKRPLKDGAEGKESEANTPAEVAEQVAKVQIGEDAGAVDEAVAKKVRNLTKKVGVVNILLPIALARELAISNAYTSPILRSRMCKGDGQQTFRLQNSAQGHRGPQGPDQERRYP